MVGSVAVAAADVVLLAAVDFYENQRTSTCYPRRCDSCLCVVAAVAAVIADEHAVVAGLITYY